jgi:CRISPR-associated endonuclease/helicase Cas3
VKNAVPNPWLTRYQTLHAKKEKAVANKKMRAQTWLLPPIGRLHGESLVGLFKTPLDAGSRKDGDEDAGQRAVRDTQETVEVMALCLSDGEIHLLPWLGDSSNEVAAGSVVRTDIVPNDDVARVAAQSTVRLPISLCNPSHLDSLIEEIERMDGQWVGAWQESRWLAGRLALLFEEGRDGELAATLSGWKLTYTRKEGLTTERVINFSEPTLKYGYT